MLSCCDLIFIFFPLFPVFPWSWPKTSYPCQCPQTSIFFFSFWSSLSSRFTYVHFKLIFLEHLRNMDIVSFFCFYLIFPAAFIRNCYYSMNILSVFATVGCRCVGFTPGFLLCFVNLNICQILCNPIYSWQRYKCNSKDNSMLFYKWCWSKKAFTFLRWPSVQVLPWEKETENGPKKKTQNYKIFRKLSSWSRGYQKNFTFHIKT